MQLVVRNPLFFTLVATFTLLTACAPQDCGRQLPTLALSINQYVLDVELASTEKAQRCGLSFRDDLGANSGMLFVYDTEQIREFWMKDTRMPLSIAFLDSDKRITQIVDMTTTLSRQRYRSLRPARYALETTLGWFESTGISVGDIASFSLPRDSEP